MISRRLIQEIETYFRRETGRTACYLPSARLGIYAALCEMFPPGAGLVLSPVTDDIVLFAILAAGLKPIFTDIEPDSGGLRPDGIQCAVAAGAMGVLTSNLYGIPDDVRAIRKVCDEHGLILVEDCAHALGCTVAGKIVGAFGEISVFSLAKHIGGLGGVVTCRDPERLDAVRRRAEPYVRHLSPLSSLIRSSRRITSDALAPFPHIHKFLKRALSPVLGFISAPQARTEGNLYRRRHRVPICKEDFTGCKTNRDLDAYDRYLAVDNVLYRQIPCAYFLWTMLLRLKRFDDIARFHRAAPNRLDPSASLHTARPVDGSSACYFKMPVFTEDRDQHITRLKASGVSVNHIYDPAFPYYLPPELFINYVHDEATCLYWSQGILPVDVLDIEKVCAYFLQAKKGESD